MPSRLLEAEGEHDHPSRATAQRIGIAHASPLVQVGAVVTDQVGNAKVKAQLWRKLEVAQVNVAPYAKGPARREWSKLQWGTLFLTHIEQAVDTPHEVGTGIVEAHRAVLDQ